jgi:hypothetical protein
MNTLQSCFSQDVKPFFVNGVLPPAAYKRTFNTLHMNIVAANKHALVNDLLGIVPPPIDPSEKTLPC